MQVAKLNGGHIHYRLDGPEDGAPVVFANSLGTDLRLWDSLLPHLPAGLRILRYDKRGHGLSDAPQGPYGMGQLVRDVEMLMDHVAMKEALFVGLSVGGMIAQGLAVKRLDLVRAMVLSNTGAKIGTPQMWAERIETTQTRGISAMSDAIMARWFSPAFRAMPQVAAWRAMVERTPPQGYAGVCGAISGTDFYTPTSGLRLPTLGIAGSEDGATPPDLVRETVGLVPGARMVLMRGVGHLPCVEDPQGYAAHLGDFIREIGHLSGA